MTKTPRIRKRTAKKIQEELTSISVWSARDKRTGLYFPRVEGRGGSRTEPDSTIPRLWPSKRGVVQFLNQWLRGVQERQEWRDPETGMVEDAQPKVLPQAHRKRENVELVEFTLVEVKA